MSVWPDHTSGYMEEDRKRSPDVRALMLLAAVMTAGCGMVPSDPDGTLERVRNGGVLRVGLVASQEPSHSGERQFIDKVATATGSRPAVQTGASEVLLSKLEEGDLDLVVGEFHSTSPWASRVAFVPELRKQAPHEPGVVVAAAARNGENAWIALLHRNADPLEAGGQ